MRTLVHLSDLHFGRVDPNIVTAVIGEVGKLAPAILVVSGDFTQRARRSQFAAARSFLDQLPGRKILVPGNHDVPLWNLHARFFAPLNRYLEAITPELTPSYADEEVAIIGINTARSMIWKGGRINQGQVDAIRRRLCGIDGMAIKIVVTHHPFDLAPAYHGRELVGRARMALRQLSRCGADVLLAGHLHEAYTGGTAKRYRIEGYSALVVQAGTATSTRRRGSPNSFNVLRIDPPQVSVEVFAWDSLLASFAPSEVKHYARSPTEGWRRLETSDLPERSG